MKNTYDILVNFRKDAYEFYEWEKSDEIEHIKKIPCIKVNDNVIYDFLNYKVVVDKALLNLLKNKTEVYYKRLVNVIEYACIIFNEDFCLALEFNSKGEVIGKSKLLFDESDDIVKANSQLDKTSITYNIVNESKKNNIYTRKEEKIINYINEYLDYKFKNNSSDEIKYIYFECFNKTENDVKKAYLHIKKSINACDFKVINKINELIKMIKSGIK